MEELCGYVTELRYILLGKGLEVKAAIYIVMVGCRTVVCDSESFSMVSLGKECRLCYVFKYTNIISTDKYIWLENVKNIWQNHMLVVDSHHLGILSSLSSPFLMILLTIDFISKLYTSSL